MLITSSLAFSKLHCFCERQQADLSKLRFILLIFGNHKILMILVAYSSFTIDRKLALVYPPAHRAVLRLKLIPSIRSYLGCKPFQIQSTERVLSDWRIDILCDTRVSSFIPHFNWNEVHLGTELIRNGCLNYLKKKSRGVESSPYMLFDSWHARKSPTKHYKRFC